MPYVANPLDTAATSKYVLLVTFTWAGGATIARYAAADKDVNDGTYTFAAAPTLTVDFNKQTGGVEDEPITLLMPVVNPVALMLAGYPFSRCFCLVEEVDISNIAGTRRKMFYGIVSQSVGNKNGNSALAEIKVAGLRSWLEFPLGIPANNTCAWQFGDKNCAKDLTALKVTRTISSISGTTITLGSAITASKFNRGLITYQGLTLMIRSQIDTTHVEMINQPPPAWSGASVVLTPGCRKTVADCTAWANIANFGGFGIAIPTFHPSVETQ